VNTAVRVFLYSFTWILSAAKMGHNNC